MNLVTREFLDHLKLERNYSECTINSYKEDIEIFFNYLLTIDVGFDAVDLQIIRDFLTDQISNGISKRTCRRRISCLRHFYKFL